MNLSHRKTLDRFSRAIVFLETNPVAFADASPGFGKQVQALRSAVASIEEVASDRGSGVSAKAVRQRALLRRALHVNQLFPVLRVARVLARTVSGMEQLVKLPARVPSTQTLLDTAKAVIRDVTPYEEQFIDMGLSANFLKRLNTTVQALETASRTHVQARQAAVGAKGQLMRSLRDGRDALTLLDSAIREMCNANPTDGASVLATWNTIVRPRGRANRNASSVVSGTIADVIGGGEVSEGDPSLAALAKEE